MKKMIAIILCIVLLFSLTACGGEADSSSDNASTNNSQTQNNNKPEGKTNDAIESLEKQFVGLEKDNIKWDYNSSTKTIVISGNFSISRDEIKKLIEVNGGKNSGSISAKTSFLLAGEKPGPEKIKKAEALGVKIITEEEFRAMIPAADGEQKGIDAVASPDFPVHLTLL